MVGRNQHRISTIIGTKPTITIYNLLHFQAALSELAPVPASPLRWRYLSRDHALFCSSLYAKGGLETCSSKAKADKVWEKPALQHFTHSAWSRTLRSQSGHGLPQSTRLFRSRLWCAPGKLCSTIPRKDEWQITERKSLIRMHKSIGHHWSRKSGIPIKLIFIGW